MNVSDWIPSLTSTVLLAAAGWLAKSLIETRLKKTVALELERQVETLRSEVRVKEEGLRAEIRVREAEIQALQSGALSALTGRRVAIDQRRLQAVDELWTAVVSLRPGIALAQSLEPWNFEEAAKATVKNVELRGVFEIMASAFNPAAPEVRGAERARPYVSPLSWALFVALRAIALNASAKAAVLRSGVGNPALLRNDVVRPLVLAALPDRAEEVRSATDADLLALVDELEDRLLREALSALENPSIDEETLGRAAHILKTAATLQRESRGSAPTA